MNNQPIATPGINWNRLVSKAIRITWALTVLLFKIALIIGSMLIALFTRLLASHRRTEDEDHSPKGIPAGSFERNAPVNKYTPYD